MSIIPTQKDVETFMQYLTNNLLSSPFPIHNGERTEASKNLLQKNREYSTQCLDYAVYSRDSVTDTNTEEEALI